MNINNLLKTSILACAMVFSISNNVNAVENNFEDFFEDVDNQLNIRYQTVNDKVFQHNVDINNGEDHIILYRYYNVPRKKHYIKNPNNERFKEIHEDSWPVDDNNEIYIAYSNDRDEYNYKKYKNKKYNCEIKHSFFAKLTDAFDTNNKFNELYKRKEINGKSKDVKTIFEEEVRKVFGDDYKVIENKAEDFSKVLEQYPGNRLQAYMEDWTQKDLIRIFPPYRFAYDFDKIDDLLIHNGFELVTKIKGYSWDKGVVIKDKDNKKLNMPYFSYNDLITNQISLSALGMGIIIITNGHDVIVFDSEKEQLNVYRNRYNTQNKSKLKSSKDLFDKLNKVGLVLQEAYKEELKLVKEVFGKDFTLRYGD